MEQCYRLQAIGARGLLRLEEPEGVSYEVLSNNTDMLVQDIPCGGVIVDVMLLIRRGREGKMCLEEVGGSVVSRCCIGIVVLPEGGQGLCLFLMEGPQELARGLWARGPAYESAMLVFFFSCTRICTVLGSL